MPSIPIQNGFNSRFGGQEELFASSKNLESGKVRLAPQRRWDLECGVAKCPKSHPSYPDVSSSISECVILTIAGNLNAT